MKKIIFILLRLTKQPLKNVFTSFGVITVLHYKHFLFVCGFTCTWCKFKSF